MDVTLPSTFNEQESNNTIAGEQSFRYKVSIKPVKKMSGQTVSAIFKGKYAHCGNCGKKIGEFKNADGQIVCYSSLCRAMNIIKK